ncbi:MAG: L-ribulose-5-phosphate 4-epimerase AraD [Bacteroidales bacterium]
MLETLRQQVLDANLELVKRGLVLYSFGNASGLSRDDGLVVIKPSGVSYANLTAESLVVTDLHGRTVEGTLRPSSDLPTHLALYRAFPSIGGVAHTHSSCATSWAQARREIPCFGTTHADYFRGPVPVTEMMTADEIASQYEWNTGEAIVRRFARLDPVAIPAVLVAGHAPFCWGGSVSEAVHVAVVLEEVARMAYRTVTLNPAAAAISCELHEKHFLRKHGPGAYYGQT